MHKSELYLPSNTANLTRLSLSNSQIFTRGEIDSKLTSDFIDEENFQPLYLFPSEDSEVLTADYLKSFDRPINLIVPDGTWRQAKKIHLREPLLKNIPRVRMEINKASSYKLRKQKYDYGLCTHEAIAYALEYLESKKRRDQLLNNLKYLVEANLKTKPYKEN